ncbi:TraR/DksA family transcriptional regulator [Nitrosomonas aestuarii]|uniref:Transcriptional regulator, TraR/DksA family n=1 Tax=Nitrosomonas aestuarii TaxID=52441 RepID=A0A1I4D1C8_9PROT|nr:TraR/DksA family transcriptional regulator [Nitrosomonas aestuarii]PTN12170.1 TraR/DksA family transcriptional regulator [Nitrosomonas aestuarii]SFK86955.1 transcriptional regulator, TraR/DksA family [Nitrosomonas aestuarii]
MANFTEEQLAQIKSALHKRYLELQAEIRSELVESSEEFNINQADDINNILADVDTALIDKQINEMRELEMSEKYLMELEFGDCADCGEEIGFERLIANPSAQRCIECQRKYEKTFPHESNPSL